MLKRFPIFSKISLAFLGLFLITQEATAQLGFQRPEQPAGLPGSPGDRVTDLVLYLINISLAVVGLIAVAYLIFGGFRYITSGGSEDGSEEAKKIIKNAIIGLIVVILSYGIVVVISNALVYRSP